MASVTSTTMAEWWSGLITWWGSISDTLTLGSIAEWVTAIIAVVAAIAAVRALRFNREANKHARRAADAAAKSNELTAQAYRDDVRVRDEAQARLVYATLGGGQPVILQGAEAPKPRHPDVPLVALPGIIAERQEGMPYAIVTQSARTVAVHVHNRSTEIISSIRIALSHKRKSGDLDASTGLIVLLPGESQEVEFVVPFDDARYVPDIAFRDATGKYWTRRGFDPIAPLPDERRNEFGLPKAP